MELDKCDLDVGRDAYLCMTSYMNVPPWEEVIADAQAGLVSNKNHNIIAMYVTIAIKGCRGEDT